MSITRDVSSGLFLALFSPKHIRVMSAAASISTRR
jgi:hypothetical protein